MTIRREAEKPVWGGGGWGGVLSKNNAKIGGLKFKLLILQGGPTFILCHVPLH